jgi:hypothetical protein
MAKRLDSRLTLLPRDYLTNPNLFGQDVPVTWHTPAGGNEESLGVAQVQHDLIVAVLVKGRVPRRSVYTPFRFSESLLSDVCLGKRWMAAIVAASLIHAFACLQVQRPRA